jgi:hypothetical protein
MAAIIDGRQKPLDVTAASGKTRLHPKYSVSRINTLYILFFCPS